MSASRNCRPWKSAIVLAELLPLLGVGQRVVERALGDPDRLRGDGDPGVVEGAHRGLEPGALLTDHPIGRDPDVVEVDLAGGRALDAELLLRGTEGDPLIGLLDHERRDALGPLPGIGHDHHRVVVGDTCVGDPPLDAVEHPVVTVADRLGLHRDRVRPGVGLGQAVGEPTLAAGQRAQVVLLELLGAGQLDRQRAELVDRRDQGRAHVDAGDLLDHQHRGQGIGTGPAVLLGDVRGVEVRREQGGCCLLRVASLLVDLGGVRRHLGLAERAHRLADRPVLLGQREQRGSVTVTHESHRKAGRTRRRPTPGRYCHTDRASPMSGAPRRQRRSGAPRCVAEWRRLVRSAPPLVPMGVCLGFPA